VRKNLRGVAGEILHCKGGGPSRLGKSGDMADEDIDIHRISLPDMLAR
jgi:hypothetical protein